MKKDIHPKYYTDAQVACSCGNSWTTGSTQKSIRTDICSQCHPFFTGEQRIVDTAGQVDRFMKRLNRYDVHQESASKRKKETRQKLEQRFLKQQLTALDIKEEMIQALHDANVITVNDLTKKVETDRDGLLELEGFDLKAIKETESKLAEAKETYFARN